MMFRKLCTVSAISLALIAIEATGVPGSATAESLAFQPTSQPSSEPMRFEDPGPEEAEEIRNFVSAYISSHSEEGRFSIPARGREMAGRMGDFHTVHRRSEVIYHVCVEFHDGYNLYDVDFVLEKVSDNSQDGDGERFEGFVISEVTLHKVNGESLRD